EQTHAILGAAENASLDQAFGGDHAIGFELTGVDCRLNAAEIDLVELAAKLVVEAALGQAAMQRHLAALEALDAHAGPRRLAFAAPAARLAFAGANAAADAGTVFTRARIVGHLVQLHCFILFFLVMPGLVAGIHDFLLAKSSRGWPGQARP